MQNVFLTHSPYHLLLADTLAQNLENSTLLARRTTDETEKLVNALSDRENNPFDDTEFVNGDVDVPPTNTPYKDFVLGRETSGLRFLKKTAQDLQSRLEDRFPMKLYTFSDADPTSQYIQAVNTSHGGTNVYTEDGTGAYLPQNKSWTIKDLIATLYFGFWRSPTCDQGAYKHTHTLLVNYPELIESRREDREILSMKRGFFHEMQDSGAVEAVSEAFNVPETITNLAVLPHHENFDGKTERQTFNKRLDDFFNGESFYAKYHPRDEKEYLSGEHIHTLPTKIPAEVITAANRDTLTNVVGTGSTALYTAREILDSGNVCSLLREFGHPGNHKSLIELFEHTGVNVL